MMINRGTTGMQLVLACLYHEPQSQSKYNEKGNFDEIQ